MRAPRAGSELTTMLRDFLGEPVEFCTVWSHFQGYFHDTRGIRKALFTEQQLDVACHGILTPWAERESLAKREISFVRHAALFFGTTGVGSSPGIHARNGAAEVSKVLVRIRNAIWTQEFRVACAVGQIAP